MNKQISKVGKGNTKFIPGHCSAEATALLQELLTELNDNYDNLVKIVSSKGDWNFAADGVAELACKLLGAATGYGTVLKFEDEEEFLALGKKSKSERIGWMANQARARQGFTYRKSREFYDADVTCGIIQDEGDLVDGECDPCEEAFVEGFNREEGKAGTGHASPSEEQADHIEVTNDMDGSSSGESEEDAILAKGREAAIKRSARAAKEKHDKVKRVIGAIAHEADRHETNYFPRPGDAYDQEVQRLATLMTFEVLHDKGLANRRDIDMYKDIVGYRLDRAEVAGHYGMKPNALYQSFHRLDKKLKKYGPAIFRKVYHEIFHDLAAA